MKNIFEIQKLEGQLLKINKVINDSPEQKKVRELNDFMRDGKQYIMTTNEHAAKLVGEMKELQAQYDKLILQTQSIEKIDLEKFDKANISQPIGNSNFIISELTKIEQRLKYLSDNMSKLLNDYQNAMNRLRVAKQNIMQAKEMSQKVEQKYEPQIKEINAKIKVLERDVDKDLYTIYRKMRSDNTYPVFVHLNDNRCAGCQMELSLNFVEKLKSKKMLQCEECHRYILAD